MLYIDGWEMVIYVAFMDRGGQGLYGEANKDGQNLESNALRSHRY